MPTYKPLGTSVRLVSCSLADSTSTNPERKKGAFPTTEASKAREAFKNATPLNEAHLPCFGERTRLHFVDEVPFYLVQAGEDLFKERKPTLAERAEALLEYCKHSAMQEDHKGYNHDEVEKLTPIFQPSTPETRSTESLNLRSSGSTATPRYADRRRASSMSKANPMPQALALIVTLTKPTFLHLYKKNDRDQDTRQNIKIDVFFNGELASSDSINNRHSGNKGEDMETNLIRITSGKRIGTLVERVWVITPPEQNANGSLREIKRSKAAQASAAERWQAINDAIMQRADEQGINKYGTRSAMGKYLANLASMPMPDSVANMQQPGGHKFGVIDVVMTAGSGDKGSTSNFYLTAPTYLRDESFKAITAERQPEPIAFPLWSSPAFAEAMEVLRFDDNALKSAATTRGHGNTATPISYRLTHPRQSQPSTPDIKELDERASVLPNLPLIPEINFDDGIDISPSKPGVLPPVPMIALNDEMDISPSKSETLLVVPQVEVNNNMDVSPPKRIATPSAANFTADFASSFNNQASESSNPITSMLPPRAPVPPSRGQSKRRPSAEVIKAGERASPKPRSPFIRASSPAGSRSGEPKLTTDEKPDEQVIVQSIKPLIHRVVLKGKDTIIVDRMLSDLYDLRTKTKVYRNAPDLSSPFQPLHESVVFGLTETEPNNTNQTPTASTKLREQGFYQPVQAPTPTPSSPVMQRQRNATPAKPAAPALAKTATTPPASGELVKISSTTNLTPVRNFTLAKPATNTPVAKPAIPSLVKLVTPALAKLAASTDLKLVTSATTMSEHLAPPSIGKMRKRGNERTLLEETRAMWKLPELSEDCVISFAEDGPWTTAAGKGSILRHIRGERSGDFKENEVVFAVRYIVAGEAGLTL